MQQKQSSRRPPQAACNMTKPLLSQATEIWTSFVTTEKPNKNLREENFKMLPRNTKKVLQISAKAKPYS